MDMYKLDEDDTTWSDWLKKNDITLKPYSQEYVQYQEDNPLPF